ncbi:DUF2470 domain-containing protein [Streptomyces uncialis]|uniref:DUF2470 domain-containing protein n=1 Tax=Streptomyces uncialis TaxID=1048205 RepID=A0A1Q4UYD0_9ACTN|nr:DUF2470 domain-containing protein [Streptomyces uncialis]MCX4662367.1 DUF2470 domain-containing protein [Streptomyces uncialis]OKH90578.1 hypothetical protein AB852_33685 [Streptomyces uncialis]
MGVRQACTTAPTAAERARSVLAAAWSCAVTTDHCHEELVGAHSVTTDGVVRLCVPEDSVLASAALCSPRGEPTALMEFSDAAPVPVRDRIRARLWLSGRFTREGEHLLFQPACAVLHAPSGHIGIDIDDFARAAPDPLATAESRLLTHLADAHADAVEWLTRLVEPESLSEVVRVQPFALDRHGLTLRLERLRGHEDVRLPFHRPADDLAQVTERMHILLASARNVRRPTLRPVSPEE